MGGTFPGGGLSRYDICLEPQGTAMRRRDFISLAVGAVVWPLNARAQQSDVPVVGFLSSRAAQTEAKLVEAVLQGLKQQGYVAGQNVTLDYRWAEGQYDKVDSLAADLVARRVSVIITTGGPMVALAAKAATSSIPIVFSVGDDPVKVGLVPSINRPDGNATGVSVFVVSLLPKRLEVLRELLPSAEKVAFLLNPEAPSLETQLRDADIAARTLGFRLEIVYARTPDEIDKAFSVLIERQPHALLLGADPFFQTRRDQLVALAARHAIPAMYEWREFVDAGGLISYSPDRVDAYRQIGVYAGRILQGAKPSELPVVQATRFELAINLKTAKALNLAVPPALLARADVIE
jgi:putative tryptophan/tyrosine transport system substrate-binding protein